MASAQERSYETAAHLVAALAGHCAGAPEKVIDLLTGLRTAWVKPFQM